MLASLLCPAVHACTFVHKMTARQTPPTISDMTSAAWARGAARAHEAFSADLLDPEIAALCDEAAVWVAAVSEAVRVAMAPIFAAMANHLYVAAEAALAGYRASERTARAARRSGYRSGLRTSTRETVAQRTAREAAAWGTVRS